MEQFGDLLEGDLPEPALGDQRGPEGTSTTGPVLLNLEYYKVVAAQLGSRGFQQVMLGGISLTPK